MCRVSVFHTSLNALQIFWAKPGIPRMERERVDGRKGGREGERDGGARAKPGNQLVQYILVNF